MHNSEHLKSFVKHGRGSVVVWSCISANVDAITHADITEAVWDHVDRDHSKNQPTSKRALEHPSRSRNTIPEDYLRTLLESLPERVQASLRNKGGDTKY